MRTKTFKVLSALITTFLSLSILCSFADPAEAVTTSKPTLKFDVNGNFKIVQFSDIQDGPDTLTSTIRLINKVLDYEKPNLVVLTGDNIDGELCPTVNDMKKAIYNIAQPMEQRKIPWAVVLGNHDDQGSSGMTKEDILKYYTSFNYNVSRLDGLQTSDRYGNYYLPIESSKRARSIFNLYFLDSGTYANPQGTAYASITDEQIKWYKTTASSLKSSDKIIPALMFFHIPLQEYYTAYTTNKLGGERLEEECPQSVNTGLFDAIVNAGDVKGVFVGHDHLNNYWASLKGIVLGYGGSVGYKAYFKNGVSRSARVIQIDESNPSSFKTWMRQEWDAQLKKKIIK